MLNNTHTPHKNLRRYLFSLFILLLTISFANVNKAVAQDSGEIHTVVDEMPEIKGGLSALYKEINYPAEARKKGISGRVFIQLIVDENGNAQNPKILRDIGGGCGQAAIDALASVSFTPGKQDGRAVKVKYSLPVIFRLETH